MEMYLYMEAPMFAEATCGSAVMNLDECRRKVSGRNCCTELPVANPMGKLDAGQCNSRTRERLEATRRGASAFDRGCSAAILTGAWGRRASKEDS